MSTKRNIQFLKGYIPCKSVDNMKTLDLVVGDIVHIANNYTFYVIEDKTSDEAIQLPNSLFAKPIPNPIAPTSPDSYTVDTIDKLKELRFLKVGDVVEVLGYYQAGDGAGHKRIIASEDDGSGVQLENGLYANIVHNGEVRITWLGVTKDTLADNNKTIINKAISSIRNLNKLLLDTSFKCYEIVLTKDIVISGISENKEDIYLKNENADKNTFVFSGIAGYQTFFKNFREVGGLNGVYSDYIYFSPNFENVSFSYCKQAGINHTPNVSYNQNGVSCSFIRSHMTDVELIYNKIGLLIDHSNIPLRQSFSNANSITNSSIQHNETGIYVKNMYRMECWEIKNSDLSSNCVKYVESDTIESYKQKISTNKYGAITLENCRGCDIEINSSYIEYSGDICVIGTNSNIENDIKLNGDEIYSNTYEYQDVILLDISNSNNAVVSKNRNYATFNMINCSNTRILCNNCWLEYFNTVLNVSGNKNSFITQGYNNLYSNYPYLDLARGIFNNNRGLELLDISKETIMDKDAQKNKYILPYYIPNNCEIGGNRISEYMPYNNTFKVDIDNFSNSTQLFNFLRGVRGSVVVTGSCYVANNASGYDSNKYENAYLFGSSEKNPTLIFDTLKGTMKILSNIGSLFLRNFNLKFVGGGVVQLHFSDVIYDSCKFDFSEFNGTVFFSGKKQHFVNCSFTGDNFTVSSSCILENKDTSNFFWNDFRTTIPEKITSYPQGHGFNLNGVDYVRKGSQWVKASDGTTQALSEVMALDTSYYSRLMEQEGIIDDYDNYRLALSKYNQQEEIEFEHSMKAYNDYLTTVTDKDNIMTYEEFEQTYGNTSMMNRRKKRSLVERLEEPTIPESVVKFMEKYLGTTPTPKVETKPRTFSFDEVDKLNDTLKKL